MHRVVQPDHIGLQCAAIQSVKRFVMLTVMERHNNGNVYWILPCLSCR